MENPAVRVEIVFRDCKHNSRISTVFVSDGFYDVDQYLYQAINEADFSPDPDDKFEIISFKMYNLRFVHKF